METTLKRMETKAKVKSVVEKKLEELESLLEAITLNDNISPNLYRKIELRYIFAQTLLAAEISSRPMDVEGEEDSEDTLELACMAKRLNELDEAFKNHVRDSSSVIESETGNMETNDGVGDGETGSVYSWVGSCPDEVGKAEEEEEKDTEQWPVFQDASSEEMKETTLKADEMKETTLTAADEEEVMVVREAKEKGRLGSVAWVCFGLIGLVFGMICLFGYNGDHFKEDDFFLTPT